MTGALVQTEDFGWGATLLAIAHWTIVVALSLRVMVRRLPVGWSLAWLAVVEDVRQFFEQVDADVVAFQEIFYSGECESIPPDARVGFVCEGWQPGDPTVANVVLGAAFGIPGVVVDTHVARIARRLGLTTSKNPVKIEFDLMDIIPRASWSDFSLHLVYFGREVCQSRRPRCPACPLIDLCPYPLKTA